MKRLPGLMAGLLMLAGCGGSAQPVGENSADSIKTTAVGNIVGTVPSPTPTPTDAVDNAAAAAPAVDTSNAATADTSAADTTDHE